MKNKNRTKKRLLSELFDSVVDEEYLYFSYEMPWKELGRNNNSFLRIVRNEKVVIKPKYHKLFPMNKNGKNDFLVRKCVNLYNKIAPGNKQYNEKIKNMKIEFFS